MKDKRLIDANAQLKKIAYHTVHDSMKHITFEAANTYEQVKGDMFSLVQKAPTIDAVEVVRCGKCAYYNRVLQACCNGLGMRPYDFFCAYGEKMDGGAEG